MKESGSWIYDKNRGHTLYIQLTKRDPADLSRDIPLTPEEGIKVSILVPVAPSTGGWVNVRLKNFDEVRRFSDDLCRDFIQGMLDWCDWKPNMRKDKPLKFGSKPKPKPKPTSAATLALLDDLDLDL